MVWLETQIPTEEKTASKQAHCSALIKLLNHCSSFRVANDPKVKQAETNQIVLNFEKK